MSQKKTKTLKEEGRGRNVVSPLANIRPGALMQLVLMTGGALFRDGKLLVLKRLPTRKFMPGLWEIPGGRIEEYESLKACITRESREETGIRVKIDKVYNTWSQKEGHKFYVEVDFIVSPVNTIKEIKIAPEEHSEFKWITQNEIKSLHTTKEMRRTIEKAFEQKGVLWK